MYKKYFRKTLEISSLEVKNRNAPEGKTFCNGECFRYVVSTEFLDNTKNICNKCRRLVIRAKSYIKEGKFTLKRFRSDTSIANVYVIVAKKHKWMECRKEVKEQKWLAYMKLVKEQKILEGKKVVKEKVSVKKPCEKKVVKEKVSVKKPCEKKVVKKKSKGKISAQEFDDTLDEICKNLQEIDLHSNKTRYTSVQIYKIGKKLGLPIRHSMVRANRVLMVNKYLSKKVAEHNDVKVKDKVDENNEDRIKDELCYKLKGKKDVQSECGFINIVTNTQIIVVKTCIKWKYAMGQILSYGLDEQFCNHEKRIHLFNCDDATVKKAIEVCAKYDIIIST